MYNEEDSLELHLDEVWCYSANITNIGVHMMLTLISSNANHQT